MEQEAVSALAHQFIDVLCVTCSTQGSGNQRLGFTTGEQRGTVSTWQHASTHIQTTDHVLFTAINTRLACQYATTNNVFLDSVQDFAQLVSVQRFVFRDQGCDGFIFDHVNLSITLLFVCNAICIAQTRFCQCSYACVQRVVYRFWLPVPTWFTSFFHQVVDVLDNNLLLVVAEDHCAQHLVFTQQFCFRFNHQNCCFSTGNNQVQLTLFQLFLSWVQHVLVVDVTDARGTDWAIEWDTRQ